MAHQIHGGILVSLVQDPILVQLAPTATVMACIQEIAWWVAQFSYMYNRIFVGLIWF